MPAQQYGAHATRSSESLVPHGGDYMVDIGQLESHEELLQQPTQRRSSMSEFSNSSSRFLIDCVSDLITILKPIFTLQIV